jgi:hypothetical protein
LNKGFKILYDEILDKNKNIHASICGSKDLKCYSDSIAFYIDWEKYNSSSVIILRNNRVSITMLNGEMVSQEHKL